MRPFVGKQLNVYGLIRGLRRGTQVCIKPTLRCNLACDYCSAEYAGSACWVKYAPERTFEAWKDQFVNEIIPRYGKIKQVTIGGGEPFLYKDIVLLVGWLSQDMHIPTYIASNLMVNRSREFNHSYLVKIKATFHIDAVRRFQYADLIFRQNLRDYRRKFLVEHDELEDTFDHDFPSIEGSRSRYKLLEENANFQITDQYGPDGQLYPKDDAPNKTKYDQRRGECAGMVANPLREKLLR